MGVESRRVEIEPRIDLFASLVWIERIQRLHPFLKGETQPTRGPKYLARKILGIRIFWLSAGIKWALIAAFSAEVRGERGEFALKWRPKMKLPGLNFDFRRIN